MITKIELMESGKLYLGKAVSTVATLSTDSSESTFKQFSRNLQELDNNIKSIFTFFGNVGKFFKEAGYWICHPGLLLDALQPWFMIALLVMIVLKLLGFDTAKWFRLCFLLFVLSLIF